MHVYIRTYIHSDHEMTGYSGYLLRNFNFITIIRFFSKGYIKCHKQQTIVLKEKCTHNSYNNANQISSKVNVPLVNAVLVRARELIKCADVHVPGVTSLQLLSTTSEQQDTKNT